MNLRCMQLQVVGRLCANFAKRAHVASDIYAIYWWICTKTKLWLDCCNICHTWIWIFVQEKFEYLFKLLALWDRVLMCLNGLLHLAGIKTANCSFLQAETCWRESCCSWIRGRLHRCRWGGVHCICIDISGVTATEAIGNNNQRPKGRASMPRQSQKLCLCRREPFGKDIMCTQGPLF